MFWFTATPNDTSMRADPVVDLDRKPYVPSPIRISVILSAYNVYPFAHLDRVRHALIASIALELLEKRYVVFYILLVREIRGIALA